jgi:tRNA (guanine-N7-)-methyltransferase
MNMVKARPPYYLNLQPYVHWPGVERPINWDGLFDQPGPLELEIGFGNGESLLTRAPQAPQDRFVGLEIAWASIKRALRRLAKNDIKNVRVLKVDAQLALERLFAPKSIDRTVVLFPVPWPKGRHERRRLFSSDFLRLLGSRLKDNGTIKVVTDFEPYVEWIFSQTPDTGFEMTHRLIPSSYDTKYGRKWRANGQKSFHELVLEKNRHYDIPVVEDTDLFTCKFENFNPQTFNPRDEKGLVTVKFKESVYDRDQKKLLVRAFVAEDRVIQEFWIKVAWDVDAWHVGLAQSANILPTAGVKRALELVREAAEA